MVNVIRAPVKQVVVISVSHIQSDRDKDVRYPVRLSPRTLRAVECDCIAYKRCRSVPQRCKHMDRSDALVTALGLEVVP